MNAPDKPAIFLIICGLVGCSDPTSPPNDAAPDAILAEAGSDAETGVHWRGFVGVAQTYADQKNGPRVDAYQAFVREQSCARGAPNVDGCDVTGVPNECGGLTFSGSGSLGRVFAPDLVAFWWPFEGGRLPYLYFSAGEVRMEGQTSTLTLPPQELKSSDGIVAFDPLETIRVSAMGADVPSFISDIQMPSRAVFSMPDLAASTLVLPNDPLEVAWTADGDVGTVEVWSAFAFTPDSRTVEMALVHCSAPLRAARLTVPPLPIRRDYGIGGPERVLAVRVQRSEILQVDGWVVQVTAASFESGPVKIVASSMDAAPPTHIHDAMPEPR